MKPASTTRTDRLAWKDIKDRIDVAAVATALLGPAVKRSGARLLWRCPFHDDHDPSFQVDPERRLWKCWPCDRGGDAAALVMQLKGVPFPEAVRHLAEHAGIVTPSGQSARAAWPTRPQSAERASARVDGAERESEPPDGSPKAAPASGTRSTSSGLPAAEAPRWSKSPRRRSARPKAGRRWNTSNCAGLDEATIRRHRLGWTRRLVLPIADSLRWWHLRGIVIPWIDEDDRLGLVKIRRPAGFKPKYVQVFRDRPGLFSGSGPIRSDLPLIAVEGELDALLLGQLVGDLANVVTVGSASDHPDKPSYFAMAYCPRHFAATDSDDPGERGAVVWSQRRSASGPRPARTGPRP